MLPASTRPTAAAALLAALMTAAASPPAGTPEPAEPPPGAASLLLLTLDTTRADRLGCYGSPAAATPTLDAVASRGTRYATALSPSPLTLPAHASLLTGLAPPEHGLRDNGAHVLDAAIPTLATVLAARGYTTGAFVASRVLDRRFGLARGFATYDDRMTAEATGEYGYPERDAAAVTAAALAWIAGLPPARPYFLWVHYYDPHAPYDPPAPWRTGEPAADYAGEIAFADREIGRLLAALPGSPRDLLVAVAGDHGEALGEHGERTHGLFLYRGSLEVPLLLAGPGVPAGQIVEPVVSTQRLASTLLGLLGAREEAAGMGPSLPGLPGLAPGAPAPAYSETGMPASAYGWSPLKALTDERWRLIVAPRPELYDWRADPGESRNLFTENPDLAADLARTLGALEGAFAARPVAAAPRDAELAAELRSLGYLSGAAGAAGTMDPKDGLPLLAELETAKDLLRAGDRGRAVARLRDLCRRSPDNIPFLTQLAGAELAAGDAAAAIAAYRRAVALNPLLDFLHLNLAAAERRLGRQDEARADFQRTLELNPRSARAWLGLGELALAAGQGPEERRLLLAAVAAGTASAAIHTRLGQIEAAAGDRDAADAHLRVATELAPGWATPWLLWGNLLEARERSAEALERYRRAATAAPTSAAALLALGRLEIATGAVELGRSHLERAAALAPDSPEGRQARRLLDDS